MTEFSIIDQERLKKTFEAMTSEELGPVKTQLEDTLKSYLDERQYRGTPSAAELVAQKRYDIASAAYDKSIGASPSRGVA